MYILKFTSLLCSTVEVSFLSSSSFYYHYCDYNNCFFFKFILAFFRLDKEGSKVLDNALFLIIELFVIF